MIYRYVIRVTPVYLIIYSPHIFVLQHQKKNLLTCAHNENSDQPAHPRSLIRVFVVRMMKRCIIGYPKCAQWRFWSESSLGSHTRRFVFCRCYQMNHLFFSFMYLYLCLLKLPFRPRCVQTCLIITIAEALSFNSNLHNWMIPQVVSALILVGNTAQRNRYITHNL